MPINQPIVQTHTHTGVYIYIVILFMLAWFTHDMPVPLVQWWFPKMVARWHPQSRMVYHGKPY